MRQEVSTGLSDYIMPTRSWSAHDHPTLQAGQSDLVDHSCYGYNPPHPSDPTYFFGTRPNVFGTPEWTIYLGAGDGSRVVHTLARVRTAASEPFNSGPGVDGDPV